MAERNSSKESSPSRRNSSKDSGSKEVKERSDSKESSPSRKGSKLSFAGAGHAVRLGSKARRASKRGSSKEPKWKSAASVEYIMFDEEGDAHDDLKDRWFFGCAADKEGDIFCTPYRETMMAVIGGRRIDQVRVDSGNPGCANAVIAGCKWLGMATGGNDYIFGVPFNADQIICIPPQPDSVKFAKSKKSSGAPDPLEGRLPTYIPGAGLNVCKWTGAATGIDGNVYCAPYNSDSVLVIESATQDFNLLQGAGKEKSKWAGAVCGPDGKIYCAPYSSRMVLVICSTTRQLSFLGPVPEGHGKWFGAAAGPDGKIYFAPHNADSVLVVDTRTQKLSYIGGAGASGGKWSGACTGFDGCIYCAPFNADTVLAINPETKSLDKLSLSPPIGMDAPSVESMAGLGKYFGAAYGPDGDGRIICSPWNADNLLVIRSKPDAAPEKFKRRS